MGLDNVALVRVTFVIKNPNELFDASLRSSMAAALPVFPARLMDMFWADICRGK